MGIARIFDWRGGPKPQIAYNNVIRTFKMRDFLSHAVTPYYYYKDTVKWKIRNWWDMVWYVSKILNQKLKRFPKMSRLGDVVSQSCKRAD